MAEDKLKSENDRLRETIYAAYAALVNNNSKSAKTLLKVGIDGGIVTNPRDCNRAE